jgi:hypothetical protein
MSVMWAMRIGDASPVVPARDSNSLRLSRDVGRHRLVLCGNV